MQHYIAQPLKGLVEIKSSPAGGEAHHEVFRSRDEHLFSHR